MNQKTEPKWVDGTEGARLLDVPTAAHIERLAAEGLIGVRKLTGVRARYRRDDIIALARNSLIPATNAPTQT